MRYRVRLLVLSALVICFMATGLYAQGKPAAKSPAGPRFLASSGEAVSVAAFLQSLRDEGSRAPSGEQSRPKPRKGRLIPAGNNQNKCELFYVDCGGYGDYCCADYRSCVSYCENICYAPYGCA